MFKVTIVGYRILIVSIFPLFSPSYFLLFRFPTFVRVSPLFSSLTPFFVLFFLRPQSIALTFYLLHQTSVRRVIHLNGFLFEAYVSS